MGRKFSKQLSAASKPPGSKESIEIDLDGLDGDEAGTTVLPPKSAPPEKSRLNEAMGALDQVVVVHLTDLASDMHRQMY